MHVQAHVQEASGSPSHIAAAVCATDTELLTHTAAATVADASLISQDRPLSSATVAEPVGSLPVKLAHTSANADDSTAALPDNLSSHVAKAKANFTSSSGH